MTPEPKTPTESSNSTTTSPGGVLPRLVRSLSKSIATTASTLSTANAHPDETLTSGSNISQNVLKYKTAAIAKFNGFVHKQKRADFPPVSWFTKEDLNKKLPDVPLEPPPAEAQTSAKSSTDPPNDVPMETATEEPQNSESRDEEISQPPEPDTLARKIQTMISSLPSFTTSKGSPSTTPVDDATDPPPPASSGSIIADSKLLSFLSSATIMNGSIEKGRQSVWSILDRLRSPTSKDDANTPPDTQEHDADSDMDDNSSVMMYGPLEPHEGSEVEIALSEIVSVDGDGEEVRTLEQIGSPRPVPISLPEEYMQPLSFSSQWKGKCREEGNGSVDAKDYPVQPEKPKKVKEYRVWLPSTTKISVETTWWGFRIYLPPPVLDVLNNKQLEAAKRAAMITAALKWLLDHLPVTLMPPQLHPAMLVLKRLVPYLGYIGGFIAWGWSGVKSFDKGYGVILTATWILPIALIPGTWELDDTPPMSPRQNPTTMDPQSSWLPK